jgi:periplasmic protein TonB
MISQKAVVAANLDDLLFIDRNKKYGAYELRKNYDKRLTVALLAAVSFFIIGLLLLNMVPTPKLIIFPPSKPDTTSRVIIKDYFPHPPQFKKLSGGRTNNNWPPLVTNHPEEDTTPVKPMTGIMSQGNGLDGIDDQPGDDAGGTGIFSIHHQIEIKQKDFIKMPDENAEFPGGEKAYENYLQSNIKYPNFAVENGIQGNIQLSLKIDETGQVVDVQVVKHLGGGCDEEAVRVLKNMPRWKPGKKDGKNVAVTRYVKVRMLLKM